MLKHYVEFVYPGSFFSETTIKEVDTRDVRMDLPKGAFAYRFFSRQVAMIHDETLVGDKKDYSPMTYFGETFTVDQIKEMPGDHSILIRNMEGNKWDRVVKTIRGNFLPLLEGDIVCSL